MAAATTYGDGGNVAEAVEPASNPSISGDGNISVELCLPGKYGLFVPAFHTYMPVVFE